MLLQYFLKAGNRKDGEGGVENIDSIPPPSSGTNRSLSIGVRKVAPEGEESTLNLPDPTQ